MRARTALAGLVTLAVAAGLPAVTAGGPAAAAPDSTPAADLIGWYKLDETSGTVAEDSATGGIGNAAVTGAATWGGTDQGFTFSGGTNSLGNAIKLPDDVLEGRDQVTIDMDVWVDPTLTGNWFLFNLGNQTSYPNGTGYLFATGQDAQGRYRGTIAENGFATEQQTSRPGGLATGAWKQVTYTVDGGTVADPGEARLYEDGRLVASSALTTSPSLIGTPDGTSMFNYLGRSAYAGDLSFKGRMRDVRLYSRALTGAEVAEQTGVTAQQAADALSVVHADDVRGNLTLPTTGPYGESVSWASDQPGVVSATGVVTRPASGSPATSVSLTATVTLGGAVAKRVVPLTVRALPVAEKKEAYAFPYFIGDGPDQEKIYLGASKGDDPVAYDELDKNAAGTPQPILSSTLGEKGLRDPFVIRSPEGDRFYLLATDLQVSQRATGFASAQEDGSKYLMVWESTDLVSWSPQRQVEVSSAFAGNTWAPEAFWDDTRGEYVVYWASALYPTADAGGRSIASSYQRMMYATTRDFVTFSEAKPWIDVNRGSGRGMIDATIAKDGSTFYRIVKDEQSFTVRQERSPDLRATVSGSLASTTSPAGGWQLVKERLGAGQPNPWGGTFEQGEGPTVFRDNEVPDRWYMFVDQPSYHGGQGYLAFRTDDIASGEWTAVSGARLPSSPRHGTVLPISQRELDVVRGAYQPDLLVSSVDDVAVSTPVGTAPALPATVGATFGDSRAGSVAVTWPAVPASAYAAAGTFTVTGTVTSGSADDPVATIRVLAPGTPTVPATPPTTPTVQPTPGAAASAHTSTVVRVGRVVAGARGGKVRIAVASTGASPGTVSIVLTRGTKVRRTVTLAVVGGRATWKLPRLRAGKPWRVTAIVVAGPSLLGSSDTARVRLRR